MDFQKQSKVAQYSRKNPAGLFSIYAAYSFDASSRKRILVLFEDKYQVSIKPSSDANMSEISHQSNRQRYLW